ncbi:MAG: ABC transporter permease [Lachnospiraceae bacterium]|nr:ABC transporter permease [Lachnospiraceae bacterium]
MMKLYGMELYKLWHQKAFGICAVCIVLFTVFWFWAAEIDMEIATVDGNRYYGYEAVKVNRQITEKYRGALTNEKVAEMIEEYGFPSEVVYDYPGWRDANYLNGFVTEYLSDGYKRDWNNYKVPTKAYAIADTELGEIERAMGGEITFAYTNGWKAFLDTLQMGMVLANVLVLLSVSTVFAQEGQTKMLPLLFTTQNGKEKDAWAKIAAAFTLTIIVYTVMVLLCLVMSVCVFGLDGAECPLGLALSKQMLIRISASYMPVVSFALIVLGMDFLAMLLLCAITMCVSAHCKSTFAAVAMAAILWGTPLLIRMLFGGFLYFLTSCMPLFLIMTDSVYESISWGREYATLWVIIMMTIICVEEGWQVYRRQI